MKHSSKSFGRLAAASMIIAGLAAAGCTAQSAAPSGNESAPTSATPKAGPQSDYPGMPQLPPDAEDKGADPSPTPQPTPAASSAAPAEETPDYDELADDVSSGVFRVVATGCGPGSKIGTAFLIDKQTAVTSYAVVAGARAAALTSGSQVISAEVSSASPELGVAILELESKADGHVFSIAGEAPAVGDPVGLVGIEAGSREVAVTTAKITETDVTMEPDGMIVTGLAKADAEIDPGRGGGPTLSAEGEVNGMAFGGSKPGPLVVIPGTAVDDGIEGAWAQTSPNCDAPIGPDLTVIDGDPPKRVRELFNDYFGGINSGDYRKAYDRLGPLSRKEDDFSGYRAGWRSSYDFDITVHKASSRSAHVTFSSIFEAGKGPKKDLTCARWDVDYTLTEADGELLINKADAHGGGKLWRAC